MNQFGLCLSLFVDRTDKKYFECYNTKVGPSVKLVQKSPNLIQSPVERVVSKAINFIFPALGLGNFLFAIHRICSNLDLVDYYLMFSSFRKNADSD